MTCSYSSVPSRQARAIAMGTARSELLATNKATWSSGTDLAILIESRRLSSEVDA